MPKIEIRKGEDLERALRKFKTKLRHEGIMDEMKKRGVTAIAPIRGCEWPMSTGGTVTRPRLCGKPVLPGSRLCEEHDVQAKGMGRR